MRKFEQQMSLASVLFACPLPNYCYCSLESRPVRVSEVVTGGAKGIGRHYALLHHVSRGRENLGMIGVEGNCALLDRFASVRAVCADDIKAAIGGIL